MNLSSAINNSASVEATSEMARAAELDREYADFYNTAQFVTGMVCYPIICVLGLTGNILTLCVMQQKNMWTSTNTILSALAVADLIKLLNDTLYFIDLVLLRTHPVAGNNMMGYMYPVSHYIFNEAVLVTAWLTVSVAVERYISVCHPMKARELCTIERARIVSVLVFLLMSLLAVPSALRYKKMLVLDTETNTTHYKIVLSSLGENKEFMTIYSWIQNLLRSIIPLFVLIILNACIIHELRRQRVKGKKMTARNRITLMLLSVVLVFLICITPDAIMSSFFGYGYVDESNLVKGVREITDMLLAVNSAVNFLIYISFSKVFRQTFMKLFFPKYYEKCHARKENEQSLLPSRMERLEQPPVIKPENGSRVSIDEGAQQTYV